MQDSAVGGSTVGNQNAYITIKLLGVPEGLLNRNFIGRLIIHELFHVASNTTQDYSHFEMYRAGYEVAAARGGFFLGRRPPNRDPGGRDETNGTNFENLIFQVCRSK